MPFRTLDMHACEVCYFYESKHKSIVQLSHDYLKDVSMRRLQLCSSNLWPLTLSAQVRNAQVGGSFPESKRCRQGCRGSHIWGLGWVLGNTFLIRYNYSLAAIWKRIPLLTELVCVCVCVLQTVHKCSVRTSMSLSRQMRSVLSQPKSSTWSARPTRVSMTPWDTATILCAKILTYSSLILQIHS